MVAAILFTWPNRRFGPAATNLFKVKGMTEIVINVDGMERRYRSAVSPAIVPQKPSNTNAAMLFL
jgi:hypothetical protein